MPDAAPTGVVALGGNAITRRDEADTIATQFRRTRESLAPIVELIREGFRLAITHGNGPQVGNALLRVELARGRAPILPLGICVADIAGGMGYMIEQSLQNRLLREGIDRPVMTLITQILVDRDDPSIRNPTKFVGQFYSREKAERLEAELRWVMREDPGRGWRQVVPSPIPRRVIGWEIIRDLVGRGVIVIAAGGGGVPVYCQEDGTYEGLDAVIDKDRASAVLGNAIGAELLLILTEVEKVALHFGTPRQKDLDGLTVAEAQRYAADGHFPRGSMGDKIEAAIQFLQGGGREVIIASLERAYEAVHGLAGTRLVP